MTNLSVICFFFVFFRLSQATNVSKNYNAKPEFDNKKSDNDLLGEYTARSLCECSALCQNECGFYGYNPKIKKCRVHKRKFTSGLSDEVGWRYYSSLPIDCKDLHESRHNASGVYEIYPLGTITSPLRVFCDMETEDGGWTAIQKRVDGSLSFYQNWDEYKNGFGSPEQNIWIGNDVIHQLTRGKNSFLYVTITLKNGTRFYEMYSQFSVSSEADKYKLYLSGNATGTLGMTTVFIDKPLLYSRRRPKPETEKGFSLSCPYSEVYLRKISIVQSESIRTADYSIKLLHRKIAISS